MIHQLNMNGMDKVQVAIERLKLLEPKEGYYLAFSGGKDSVVIKALADMAGVKYDAHYTLTSVDPPELVRFVKTFPDVLIERPKDKNGNQITMWNLIARKAMPPTSLVRYCCYYIKESGGDGRMTITGVRWAESVRRKQNQGEVTIMNPDKQTKEQMLAMDGFSDTKKGGVVLNNDNAESRKMVEQCYKRSKTTVNPIIDWTDGEVWEFIHEYNVPYCELYDKGFKRLGCIGCPMSRKTQIEELEQRPKYKRAYLRAFKRMLENSKARGLNPSWANEYEVYDWWIGKESGNDQGTR